MALLSICSRACKKVTSTSFAVKKVKRQDLLVYVSARRYAETRAERSDYPGQVRETVISDENPGSERNHA